MRRLFILFCLGLAFVAKTNAQSCFNVNAGNDTLISCIQNCLDLHARVPDLRTSETYQVVPIAYAPYAYTTPFGTTDPLVNSDDHFSDSFTLPFPFCFYGNTYFKAAVGSNAVITFDVKTNANTIEGYLMDPGDVIPFAGGSPNVQTMYYAPRASIFIAYVDLNPATSPPGNKIEWRVEGTAPCRRFVVSYYLQANYDLTGCPFNVATNNGITTMQAVLYEGSGIIDVFYHSKPACLAYQGGLAIAGVQNWAQDQAVTPPGWNGTVWTADDRGIRYVPSGPTSLLSRVELYKNNVLISTGTPTVLGNGELDITFPNICQSEDSMSYVVKAFYKQCDNPAVETEGSDTMIVRKSLGPVNTDVQNVLCNGGMGKISVTAPLGPNMEYSIDGGTTWQASTIFIVPAGTYDIIARNVGTPCQTSVSGIVVSEPPALSASSGATPATCPNNDGSITINANGGTPAYTYSIDGGVSFSGSNNFTGLSSGVYAIVVKDANGCTTNLGQFVPLDDTMRLELGPDTTICFGSSVTLMPQTNALTDTFRWTPRVSLDYDTAMNPVATPNDTTKYYLTAKWGVCQRTDSIRVNILHKPNAYAGNDTTICSNTVAFLNGSAGNYSGPLIYNWSPKPSTFIYVSPDSSRAAVTLDTSQSFIFNVKDNYGCNFSVFDTMRVFVAPPIPAFAGNDTNALLGKPHQLKASGGVGYEWSPAGPLNNAHIANPKATLYTDTYFRVTVSDSYGCKAFDDIFIKVYEGPAYYLPNAFTPNGDGLNDIFMPEPVGIKFTDYFMIFNRFGETIFQTREWHKGWDGTYKGKPSSPGTYVWIIKGRDENGNPMEFKGTVNLIR